MNARVHLIDRESRIVWVNYEGRGDELAANFAVYDIDAIPSLFNGRIGLSYRRGMSEESIGVFADNAVVVVGILTMRCGVSKRMEKEFATALMIVQTCQKEESEQGRELAAFVRGVRRKVGGAA